jgi:hypothetical protein
MRPCRASASRGVRACGRRARGNLGTVSLSALLFARFALRTPRGAPGRQACCRKCFMHISIHKPVQSGPTARRMPAAAPLFPARRAHARAHGAPRGSPMCEPRSPWPAPGSAWPNAATRRRAARRRWTARQARSRVTPRAGAPQAARARSVHRRCVERAWLQAEGARHAAGAAAVSYAQEIRLPLRLHGSGLRLERRVGVQAELAQGGLGCAGGRRARRVSP